MSRGFVKLVRTEEVEDLLAKSPMAFVLAAVIALRARYSNERVSIRGLNLGEAFIGDHESYGMTQQQYRTAKANLEKWGLATFKPTNKGTIARLTGTQLFDPLSTGADAVAPSVLKHRLASEATSKLTNGVTSQPTHSQRASQRAGQRLTKNKEVKKGKNKDSLAPTAGECEAIFSAYPVKAKKPKALRAIAEALERGVPYQTLLDRTKAFAACWHGDLRYCPEAHNWFRDEGYNDDQQNWGPRGKQRHDVERMERKHAIDAADGADVTRKL